MDGVWRGALNCKCGKFRSPGGGAGLSGKRVALGMVGKLTKEALRHVKYTVSKHGPGAAGLASTQEEGQGKHHGRVGLAATF